MFSKYSSFEHLVIRGVQATRSGIVPFFCQTSQPLEPVRAAYLFCLCLFLLGIVLRLTTGDGDILIILPLIAAAGVYTLSPQIRWWHWLRNPPDLPTALAPLLERFDLYRRLGREGKREFRRRTFMLKEGTHIHGQAIEHFPEDVKVMVAASAATVSFHREDFLIGDFENVIFYRHYFPSPVHEVLHSSELHVSDGAIIWTLNVFLQSVVEPLKYLQLGIYEYARALYTVEPNLAEKMNALALDYQQVEQISGFSEAKLKEFIGLPEPDLAAITHVLYFTHREQMQVLFGDSVKELERLFG